MPKLKKDSKEDTNMNKWYYTWHMNVGSLSIFETSEYEGRGGYDTKEDAEKAAKAMLTKKQSELCADAILRAQYMTSLLHQIDQVNKALLDLDS
jgi:hypothetical protein